MANQSRQGKVNKDQSSQQYGKQTANNDVEFGSEYTMGNTQSQSQKKSGKQMNKQ
ncbi:hypothetical protein [Ectobacillus panaciterrae]|uniref:hypothetical protein n=1 Tax=Ectobacillus panaciterrae TaxID=363872 RepID=UPI00040F1720|nr:hypothetical protein [Ectobacillus panaciterrae]